MSQGERVIVRALLGYARRSINYLVEPLDDQTYRALTDDDPLFNDIQYIIDSLEYRMSECTNEIVAQLETMNEHLSILPSYIPYLGVLQLISNYIGAMVSYLYDVKVSAAGIDADTDNLAGLLTALQGIDADTDNLSYLEKLTCICFQLGLLPTIPGDIPIDDDDSYPPLPVPDDTSPFPGGSSDACAIAQLSWQAVWELMTEIVLPSARTAFDDLGPLVAAALIGWAGGPIAIAGVYVVAETIQELLELGYTYSEENYINWLFSVKDDWICEVYGVLNSGGSESAAIAAMRAMVDASSTISYGDKLATKLFVPACARGAAAAYVAGTDWATENVTPGACDDCDPAPGDYVWSGVGCPDDDDFDSLVCVGGFPCVDVAKEVSTLPPNVEYDSETTAFNFVIWARGTGTYGGDVAMRMRKVSNNDVLYTYPFTVAISADRQIFSDTISTPPSEDVYFDFYTPGSGVARIEMLSVTRVP
jgi:hypothetical protein